MAFLDFLTGGGSSSQPVSQQGLPPEHSTVARLLELLGGFTGFAPLAGVGYLADQPTENRYNEAAWPRFKDMLAKSGVPQQKLDNLDLLPIQARVGAANQLWQASLQQQKQPGLMDWWRQTHTGGTPEQYEQFLAQSKPQKPQKQSYVPEMLPSGREAFVDPLSGRVLSTLPSGAYTQSFKPTKDQTMDPATREAATTTARLQATQAFKNQQPFNQVDKENIPFMTLRDGREVPIPTTTPYGQIVNKPGVFYLPKTLVTNGTYMRLTALPTMGQQLVASSKVLGSGGLSGLGRREYMKLSGNPSYSAYKTAGANYVDTVASVFSRRVSQSLIDSWREAIYGNFASPESVKVAVDEINQNAATMKSSIRATGPSDSTALPPGLPDMSGVGTPVTGPDGRVTTFKRVSPFRDSP